MANIFTCLFLQLVFTIGIIFVFGWLISLCSKGFYRNFGEYGTTVCYITGFFGTPIHECAHALFCLIFGHKIVEMKLFQVDSDDGTLGYVKHSYNKRNPYMRIGNFFIGVAPIIVISAILYLIAYLLLPEFAVGVFKGVTVNGNFAEQFGAVFTGVAETFISFFRNAASWQFWVFAAIGAMLALHMNLSKADIRGTLDGLIFLLLVFLIVDIVLGLVYAKALNAFTSVVISLGGCLTCFLALSLTISIISLLISCIFGIIKK